jgi:hypothetical protein
MIDNILNAYDVTDGLPVLVFETIFFISISGESAVHLTHPDARSQDSNMEANGT